MSIQEFFSSLGGGNTTAFLIYSCLKILHPDKNRLLLLKLTDFAFNLQISFQIFHLTIPADLFTLAGS